jgi:hypothetical protein
VLHPRINNSNNPDSSTLTAIEPRHPRRFENRKNISHSPGGSFASQRASFYRSSSSFDSRWRDARQVPSCGLSECGRLVGSADQGLENRLIDGSAPRRREGQIRRRPRLGGLLNYYERAA